MNTLQWVVLIAAVLAFILLLSELGRIAALLRRTVLLLESLDAEVFHLAQEQNPKYGLCSDCHERTTVFRVVRREAPKDASASADGPEIFYCKACWWLSGEMDLTDAEPKYYKDRLSDRDRLAARVGPGPLG